jgi:hypothetical protein
MNVRNEVDYKFLAGLYSQMFVSKSTVLSANSDLLQADYKHSQITNVKCFITLGPGFNHYCTEVLFTGAERFIIQHP